MKHIPNAETPPVLVRATPFVARDASELGGGDSPNVLRSYYDHDGIVTTRANILLNLGLFSHRTVMETPPCY